MKIRGIVMHSFRGSASRGPSEQWMLPLHLQPWRDVGGALRSDVATTWDHAETMEVLDAKRANAPSVGEIVEVEVEAPERIVGLDRPRAQSEFARLSWAPAVDDELLEHDAKTAPRDRVEDVVLGEFRFDEHMRSYSCSRRIEAIGWTYELHVTPLEPREPTADIAVVRADVAWLEANAAAICKEVAGDLWPIWNEGWRQPDEGHVDRAAFESALTLASASFDSEDSPNRFTLYLSDGDRFGGHFIDVAIVNRRVVTGGLSG